MISKLRAARASLALLAFTALAALGCATGTAGGRTDGARLLLSMPMVENAYPHWSKDGSHILFQSNRSGNWQLYTMDANGGAQQPIAESKHNDNFADWSPDNTMIAFVSDRGGDEDVWVMAADGSGARNVSHNPGRDIHPFWTPDGGSILFNSTRATANEHFDVYSMAPDGSDLTVVRADADEKTCARRSPTAARIVYLKGAENDEIYAMNADGSGDTNLTKSDAAEGWPTWTPDGRRIVFSSRRDGRFALCVMDADGSRVRQISFPPEGSYDARPNISADGSKIVFNRQTGRTIAIYVMPMPPTRS